MENQIIEILPFTFQTVQAAFSSETQSTPVNWIVFQVLSVSCSNKIRKSSNFKKEKEA